jgi:hypothetical protein
MTRRKEGDFSPRKRKQTVFGIYSKDKEQVVNLQRVKRSLRKALLSDYPYS